jgi:hypothetical protein
MVPKCLSRSVIVLLVIIAAIGLSACAGGQPAFARGEPNSWTYRLFSWDAEAKQIEKEILPPGTYAVDPIFIDFYQALGGVEVLGPAISASRNTEGKTSQYTESSLMVFDPLATASNRFQLAPLGITLGVAEGNQLGQTDGDGRLINDKLVVADFLATYESLGGARFVGRPISDATFNVEKGRLEQYFENLGFYQIDGKSTVHLMPYGAYACDRKCRDQATFAAIPMKQSVLPPSFLQKAIELGLPFVGKPLTGLHIAPDGKQEVIFDNLVLVAEADSMDQVTIRPVAVQISRKAQKLVEPADSNLSIFFEVEDGLGYNVPLHFRDYINQNGGMQISGQPISEVFSPQAGIYWQCFTNLCLQFNMNVEGEQRLSPVPLGREYKAESFQRTRDFDTSQDINTIDIRVWEKDTFVSAAGSQEIHTVISEEGTPLRNFEPLLIATMPDGSQRKAYFPPSDSDGLSAIMLAPIKAPNGTLIAYRVCLFGLDGQENCVGDNYLIWDTD